MITIIKRTQYKNTVVEEFTMEDGDTHLIDTKQAISDKGGTYTIQNLSSGNVDLKVSSMDTSDADTFVPVKDDAGQAQVKSVDGALQGGIMDLANQLKIIASGGTPTIRVGITFKVK